MKDSYSENNPWIYIDSPDKMMGTSYSRLKWGKDFEGKCLLIYELQDDGSYIVEDLPKFTYLEMDVIEQQQLNNLFIIRLLDIENVGLFYRLCQNIIEVFQIYNPVNDSDSITRIKNTTLRWHDFMSMKSEKKLSTRIQMGIIGELLVLDQYLLKSGLTYLESIRSWDLPTPSPKDFRINKFAIEAKTRSDGKTFIQISSADQLDSYNLDHLFLCVTDLEKASSSSVKEAFSLSDIANEIKHKIMDQDYEAFNEYENRLNQKGFSFYEDYDKKYWIKASTKIYKIDGSFPSIIRSDISNALSKISYNIDLNECEDYIVDENHLFDCINIDKQNNKLLEIDDKGIKDLINNGENKKVEFKASFSTPIEDSNPKNLTPKELEKALTTSALKTITAFMNTEGGTLIIGVYEDKNQEDPTIIGIESDKYENNDQYGRMISQQIQNRIGKKYGSLINISFKKMFDKTVCLIECPGSNILQQKKWGPAPLKKDKNSHVSSEEYYIRGSFARADQIYGGEIAEFMQSWKW